MNAFLSTTHLAAPGNEIIDKIRSFGSLPEGWDFGIGDPAPNEVIESAIVLYRKGTIMGLRADAFPGTGGAVYVAFYKGIDTLEVCINPDVSVTITVERGIGMDFEELDYKEGLTFLETIDYLNHFAVENRCNSSEPYIAISTTRNDNDSRVIVSRTTMEVFQLSTLNASPPQVRRCAGT
jgi:hypothetical protein